MKESALTQQSDCQWVRALDSNGNSILISKEDLASVVGELLPVASPSQKGLMSANIYKTSTAHTLPPNKKVRIISRDKYVETILEFVGRSVFEEFVHLIIKHANQQVNIEKGAYNNAPDERIEYKFYYDSSSVYIITPSNNSTIRLVGTTNKDNIKYEEMSDMSIDGLTPIILS